MPYTRLSYNTKNWISPSGLEGKSTNIDTFEHCGFGMEEWLFNELFLRNSFHYGYIEGLKDYKEGDENEPLILFSIQQPSKNRFLVAIVDQWQKLNTTEAETLINDFYPEIMQMRNQVSNLPNINIEEALKKFDEHITKKTFFNIKFKAIELLNGKPLSAEHPVQKYYRFQINNRITNTGN